MRAEHFFDETWWNELCRPPCRCVTCTQCGATTPGLRCEWQKNYTQCAPCASLVTCPICLVDYSEGATILQCRQCDRWAPFLQAAACLCTPLTRLSPILRWFHASCQSLHSEEDVEKAAENGFNCTMCRTFKSTKGGGQLLSSWTDVCDACVGVLTPLLICCCSGGQGQRRHRSPGYDPNLHEG